MGLSKGSETSESWLGAEALSAAQRKWLPIMGRGGEDARDLLFAFALVLTRSSDSSCVPDEFDRLRALSLNSGTTRARLAMPTTAPRTLSDKEPVAHV